jgi:hypothetical protein
MTVLGDRFVKRRLDAPAGYFEVEAAGLRWLAVPVEYRSRSRSTSPPTT